MLGIIPRAIDPGFGVPYTLDVRVVLWIELLHHSLGVFLGIRQAARPVRPFCPDRELALFVLLYEVVFSSRHRHSPPMYRMPNWQKWKHLKTAIRTSPGTRFCRCSIPESHPTRSGGRE
jgi:hypothetical protein